MKQSRVPRLPSTLLRRRKSPPLRRNCALLSTPRAGNDLPLRVRPSTAMAPIRPSRTGYWFGCGRCRRPVVASRACSRTGLSLPCGRAQRARHDPRARSHAHDAAQWRRQRGWLPQRCDARPAGRRALPDCRAYEQVSTPDKNGSPVLGTVIMKRSGRAPSTAAPSPIRPRESSPARRPATPWSLLSLLARSEGWSSRNLLPPQAPGSFIPFPAMRVFSQDLSTALLINGGGSATFGQDQPALVPGEPHNINLFLRDNIANTYQLVDLTPPTPFGIRGLRLCRLTRSGSRCLRGERSAHRRLAAGGRIPHLFEWSAGAVRLVGILPDGTPCRLRSKPVFLLLSRMRPRAVARCSTTMRCPTTVRGSSFR